MTAMTTTFSEDFLTTTTAIACPTAAQHKTSSVFPKDLTLSPFNDVNTILAEVPFFCVGVMGFALLIFCLATKRLSKPLLYMIASSLAAFVAVVIDLSAMLDGTPSNIFALAVATHMAFAVSIGLRFLFFWVYCSRRPEFEPIDMLANGNSSPTPTPSRNTHSASWTRFGILGVMFHYTLFLGCLVVVVLEVIWRFGAIFKLKQFIPEYRADAIAQIALSVIFIAKFISNAYLSSRRPRWKIWRTIGPTLLALFVQVGIGIGGIIVAPFSETPLGRLMQALVVYIVFITLLVSAFLEAPVEFRLAPSENFVAASVNGGPRHQRTSSFAALNPRPRSMTDPGLTLPPPALLSRRTTAERVSQWFQARVSGRPTEDQLKLWDQRREINDVEKGGAGTPDQERTISDEMSPMGGKAQEVKYGSPNLGGLAGLLSASTANATDGLPYITRSESAHVEKMDPNESLPQSYGTTSDILAVGTAMLAPLDSARPSLAVTRADSPVYGLEGIIRSLNARAAFAPPEESDTPAAEAELLRQREELDQSVRSLQLMSPAPSTIIALRPPTMMTEGPIPPIPLPAMELPEGGEGSSLNASRHATMTTIGQESISTSIDGSVSLRDFPTPPAALQTFATSDGNTTGATSPSPSRLWNELSYGSRYKGKENPVLSTAPSPSPVTIVVPSVVGGVDAASGLPMPPRMPAAAEERPLSFPSTTRGSDLSALFNQSPRVEKGPSPTSGGRDVTSFIGGLSRPDGVPLSAASSHIRQDSDKSKVTVSSTIQEEDESRATDTPSPDTNAVVVTDARRASAVARARIIAPDSGLTSFTPMGRLTPDSEVVSDESGVSWTFANSSTKRPTGIPLPSNPRPAGGRSTPQSQGRSTPQSQRSKIAGLPISEPYMAPEPLKNFERPRPPPLVLKSGSQPSRR